MPGSERHTDLLAMLRDRRKEAERDVDELVKDEELRKQSRRSLSLPPDPDIEARVLEIKKGALVLYDEALRQLEAGEYGLCSDCGNEINFRRLRALPFAQRCKECQEAQSAREAQERIKNNAFTLS